MINKPNDFETARAFDGNNTLPADGYVCVIKSVKEATSKAGNEMVEIALDIAEGEYTNFYLERFKQNTNQDKKWSNNAIMRTITTNKDGTTNGNFKHFVNCAEESNNFKVTWGEEFCNCLKDKRIGVLFGREQYQGTDGELRWSTKAVRFKRVAEIREHDFEIPKDKPLEGVNNNQTPPQGFSAINDDDIPF